MFGLLFFPWLLPDPEAWSFHVPVDKKPRGYLREGHIVYQSLIMGHPGLLHIDVWCFLEYLMGCPMHSIAVSFLISRLSRCQSFRNPAAFLFGNAEKMGSANFCQSWARRIRCISAKPNGRTFYFLIVASGCCWACGFVRSVLWAAAHVNPFCLGSLSWIGCNIHCL